VEEMFSRAGQLSFINVDPDALPDMVSIMINKRAYKPSVKDIMDKYFGDVPCLSFIKIHSLSFIESSS